MTTENLSGDYVSDMVIPSKMNNLNSSDLWAIKDMHHRFWLASNSYANLFGLNSYKDLAGKNLADLNLSYKKNVDIIHEKEKNVIKSGKSSRGVLLFNIDKITYVYAVTITPLTFGGVVIGVDEKFTFVGKHRFELNRIHLGEHGVNRLPLVTKTEQEKYVIYLLILNKTQHEVANYLGVSRSRIVQIITRLSGQLGVSGCATKFLIDQAIANDYHMHIPVELFLL